MSGKCEECNTPLTNLYYKEMKKGKLSWETIQEKYCRKCKTPVRITNWFGGEKIQERWIENTRTYEKV